MATTRETAAARVAEARERACEAAVPFMVMALLPDASRCARAQGEAAAAILR